MTTTTGLPDETDVAPHAPPKRPRRVSLLWTIGGTALVLGAFDWFSSGYLRAKIGIWSERPPVYGQFRPGLSKLGAIALVLAVVAGIAAFLVARRDRVRPAAFLAVAVAFMLSFSAAIAIVNGDSKEFVDPIQRVVPADYQVDVKLVRQNGVREFISNYSEIAPTFKSVHTRTHPPGPVVLLSFLQSAFPNHLAARAVVIAFLSALMLVPTWFLARMLVSERAAMYAVMLLAVTPGPLMFAFTSLDAVFGTIIVSCAALLVWGLDPRSPRWAAVLAGAATGAGVFFTYAVFFVLPFAVLWTAYKHGVRDAAVRTGLAAGGGLAMLLAMRVVLGFDLLEVYGAGHSVRGGESKRSFKYWTLGNHAAWMTFAGVPLAAAWVRELCRERAPWALFLFAPMMIFWLIPSTVTKILPGETERTWMFVYAFAAVAAGAMLTRWEASRGRRRPGVIGTLVLVTALQAVLLEALFRTLW